jgi:flagellar basal-body rod protein FlgC
MMSILTGISSTASALNAERIRMEVIAQNIANANTTHALDGKPYQRQMVVFEKVLRQQQASGSSAGIQPQTIEVARIERDRRPPRLIPMPGHQDADANGMVAVPDINIHEEMADYVVASRSFEANLAVVKNARSIALQTLGIGKRA